MDTCSIICTQQVNNLKLEVRQKLIQANIEVSSINGLEDVLNEQPSHPFDNIYLFKKYCADHMGCVVSEQLLHELYLFGHQNLLLVNCNCISYMVLLVFLSYRNLKKFQLNRKVGLISLGVTNKER